MPSASDTPHAWTVICLCAQWCGVCREWRAAFDAIAAAQPDVGFAWVDVEDEAQAMGDVDIETFPTMLIAQGADVRFFGPIPPAPAQLTRLLASLRAEPLPLHDDEAQTLLQRLATVLLLNP